MRLFLVDTTRYEPASPFFLEAAHALMSQGRLDALHFFDEARFLPARPSLRDRFARKILKHPLGTRPLNDAFVAEAVAFRPDVTLIVKGTHLAPEAISRVRSGTNSLLANYAPDDPFNPRASSSSLRAAIPQYDLYACTKRAIIPDILAAGCPRAEFVPFAFKPEVHFPEQPSTEGERQRFSSDVVFIGGYEDSRASLVRALLRADRLAFHLYGDRWGRHPDLRPFHRGPAVGRDFRLALSASKIALNFVRHANRDGHVMRTFELPACGAFMLAERTTEQLELLNEDEEAVFFSDEAELVNQTHAYLDAEDERLRIARAGHRAMQSGGHTYGDRLAQLLDIAGNPSA